MPAGAMASISIIITDLLSIIHAARRVKRFFLFYNIKNAAYRISPTAPPFASLRNLTTPVRSSASISEGINKSCSTIPGIAFKKAPAKNICHVNTTPVIPVITIHTAPHKILPPSIAITSDLYNDTIHCHLEWL